ncbi:helix-turn-helix domain-containing protein [uncultured Celeribacter sp.]|uniref:helix-turn-helix domain-containing protein n=1 Tax=uncultured Celeribacter sp. TaxID=1303376 RepID=UPI0037487528
MKLDIGLHKQLRAELRARGVSLNQIAVEIDRSPALVTAVSQGRCKSHLAQSAIARHLERRPEEIWPDRYLKEENA